MSITPANPIIIARALTSTVLGPYTVSVNTAVVMPSAANMIGNIYTIINSPSSTANILVQAADGSLIRTVYPGTTGQVTPNTDTPATTTQWEGVGVVQSNWTVANGLSVQATNTAPSFGTGGSITGHMRRNGQNVDLQVYVYTGSSGSASAGSGEYVVGLPTGPIAPSIDYTQLPTNNQVLGRAYSDTGSSGPIGDVITVNSGFYSQKLRIATSSSTWNSTNNAFTNAYGFSMFASFPVVGWTATKG